MTNKIIAILVFCTSLFVAKDLLAQANERLEIPIANNMEAFTIPIGNQGVVVLIQTSNTTFNLRKYDTDLQPGWNITGTIGNNLDYVTHSFDGKHIYLLFSKYRSNAYEVVKVFPGAGFIEKYQIFSIDRIEISDFEASDNAVFIAGVLKAEPMLFYTDLNARKSKVLPAAFKTTAEIQSMEIDTSMQRVNVTFAVGKAKDYRLIVKSFGFDGEPVTEIHLDEEDALAMMNGKLNTLNNHSQIMMGTYGFKKSIGTQKGPYSQGVYLTKIEGDAITDTKFYDFTDFQNFFSYLNPKQKERQERKVKDKKDKGKDLQINQRMLVHNIIPQKDGYLFVAESFFPEFRYNNNMYGNGLFGSYSPFYYSPYFNPYRWGYGYYGLYSPFSSYYGYRNNGNNQVFDGWRYTHGVVAAFDKQGNLLWDNTIEIKDLKINTLKQKVKVNVEGDEVTLSYSNKGEVFSKTINKGTVVKQLSKRPLAGQKDGDNVRRTSTDDIDNWYDNYFIASGVQRITNTDEGRRNVIYLQKLSF
jgi:small nuclear ribonucleoprotein (snRNP)-like protein